MRSHVRSDTSVDRQTLVHVTFERETPEANAPTIEVVFQFNTPETFDLTNLKSGILVLLSVTRTDTRTSTTLTKEEEIEVYQLASEYASGMTE